MLDARSNLKYMHTDHENASLVVGSWTHLTPHKIIRILLSFKLTPSE